ncbi:MAG: transglutaminase-like domain-containing protein [bacterium]|nr:transglutaminase-like domain-containing protein [bacterium]
MLKRISQAALLLSIAACSSPKIHIPYIYESRFVYYGEENVKATAYSIKEAGKLSEEYPDESILNDEIKITMRFERNDEYDSSAFEKLAQNAKKSKSKKDKEAAQRENEMKQNEARILKGDFSNLKLTATDDDDDLTEFPIPDGEVFTSTKFEYEYTTLKDYVSEPFYVYYNSMTNAKNFKFKINDQKVDLVKNKEKSSSSDYFKTDSRYLVYDMSLPIRGTRVNARYLESCRDAKFNSQIYILEDHYTEKKVIKISKPDWLDLDLIEMNFEGLDYKKEEIEEVGKSDDDDDDSKNGNSKKSKFVVYTFKNLKPYQHYKGGRGPSYNQPLIYIHYKTVGTEGNKKNIFNSTDDMYRWYKLVSGTLQNDTAKFSEFTRNLVKNAKSDEEKIRIVFYWMQDNIHYLAFEDGIAGFRPDECSNVFSKKFGDCKGMANLTKNMLKVLGFDARLVWIGTRHLNFSYDIPGLPVDNHAICAVKINNKFLFLDATETYCAMGDYANRIQGRRCIVENGPNYSVERIPEFGFEHNEEFTNEVVSIDGNSLIIEGQKQFKGESKIDFLRSYNLIKTQQKEKFLFNYLTKDKVSINAKNITSSDLTNRDINTDIKYQLAIDNHAFTKGNKKYVNLEWDNYFSGYHFDSIRKVDYDFGSKVNIRKQITLNLGKEIASNLPQPVNIDNDYYNFNLEIKQIGTTLKYTCILITKQDYIPASMFKTFNADSKKLSDFYNTYIELN